MQRSGLLALSAAIIGLGAPAAHAATALSAGATSACAKGGCFSDSTHTFTQAFSSAGLRGPIDVGSLLLDRSVLGGMQDKVFKVSFQLADGTSVGDWGGFMIAGLGGQVVTLGGKSFTWDPSQGDLTLKLDLVVPDKAGLGGGLAAPAFSAAGGLPAPAFGGGGFRTGLGSGMVTAGAGSLGSGDVAASVPFLSGPSRLIVVPEPASWALMLAGFGAAGSLLRSQRRRQPAV